MQLAVLLAATQRMVFGTCIANIWARPSQTMNAAAAQLAQAYPGRIVVGLGSGIQRRRPAPASNSAPRWPRCVTTWTGWTTPPGHQRLTYPRIIAANGPKMLALAGDIADGAMPAVLPAEFTAQARQVLGPDNLLVVGLSVVADLDAERAKATAREVVSARLGVPSYAARMAGLGYSAHDIAEVSDRLVDALVAHGDSTAIAVKVREHLVAGADHVTLLLPIGGDFATGVDLLERLAPALADLG